MPQPFNTAVITDNGAQLLVRAQAGEIRMEFTRIVIGNGSYSAEEQSVTALQKRTSLKAQKNSYPLSDIIVNAEHSVKVTALITNQNPATGEAIINEGYYINEMGLYAKVKGGDDSTEILYSITTTAGENGDFMPPYNGYNPAQIIQDYYATVSNSSEVTICTNNQAVALAEDVEEIRGQLAELNGNIFLLAHPVGEIYETINPTNPGQLYGGTWISWGAGRVTVGVDPNNNDFNTAQKAGGALTHTHTSAAHSHTIPGHIHTGPSHTHTTGDCTLTENQIPAHRHTMSVGYSAESTDPNMFLCGFGRGGARNWNSQYTGGGQAHNHGSTGAAGTGITGSSGTMTSDSTTPGSTGSSSNLPPYITCYKWLRTA